ncbi:MAG: o-succinylbenzoate synthase [Raineya sp.]
MKASYQKYTLHFKFEAGTSRGILTQKDTYFIRIWDENTPEMLGVGEANVLKGLSIEDSTDFEQRLQEVLQKFQAQTLQKEDLSRLPAIAFALETAQKDLENGGKKVIYKTKFVEGQEQIPINGLIWMGTPDFMLAQIKEKVEKGFRCLKMKIGAIDFFQELQILKYIRREFSHKELILRVDANGAFASSEALAKLNQLAELQIHSIEQPIATKQWEALAKLCEQSPVPIALDEELIGISLREKKENLLKKIKPSYIILKPALLGGFAACQEWIDIAESLEIGWWITSALESNIGLNAIAQWTSSLPYRGHQGLGTGQLYQNNIVSPLYIEGGFLGYEPQKSWQMSF